MKTQNFIKLKSISITTYYLKVISNKKMCLKNGFKLRTFFAWARYGGIFIYAAYRGDQYQGKVDISICGNYSNYPFIIIIIKFLRSSLNIYILFYLNIFKFFIDCKSFEIKNN